MLPPKGFMSGEVAAVIAHRRRRPCTQTGHSRTSSRTSLIACWRLQVRGSLSPPMPSRGESGSTFEPYPCWLSKEGEQQQGDSIQFHASRLIHTHSRPDQPSSRKVVLENFNLI
jgi:hypothetical protein